MKWNELDKKESEENLDALNHEFQILCDENMMELRRDLVSSFNMVLNELNITDDLIRNNAYRVDYLYSLQIYKILSEKFHINLRNAS